jgi:hypothetical protein
MSLIFVDAPGGVAADIIGWFGNAFALFFFISPALIFYQLIHKKITIDKIPYPMILANIMNCIMWLAYGILKDDYIVYICNGLGSAFSLTYISLFWVYFFDGKPIPIIAAITLTLYLAFSVVENFIWIIKDADITGYVAMAFNIIMYSAPGSSLVIFIPLFLGQSI